MSGHTIKSKLCSNDGCSNEFTPYRTTDKYCSFSCASSSAPPLKKRTRIKPITKKSLVKIRKDNETYKLVWMSRPHNCEECDVFLGDDFDDVNGKVIDRFRYSHILTKGAFPEHRHNIMNFNLLCLKCHEEWENGAKEKMSIWDKNERVIEKLKASTIKTNSFGRG